MKYSVTVGGRSFEIEIDHDRLVWVDGRPMYVNLEQVGGLPVYSLSLNDEGYVLFVEKAQDGYQVEVEGEVQPVAVRPKRPELRKILRRIGRKSCTEAGEGWLTICAPLAGRVISCDVAVGDQVTAGQVVTVVESMKMQMELKTPRPGIVEAVHAQAGQDVGQGETLVLLGDLSPQGREGREGS